LHRGETWGFWNQIAFVNQRHLAFATGIFLLVLVFLVNQYLGRTAAAGADSHGDVALLESEQATYEDQLKTCSRPHVIRGGQPTLTSARGFVFSGLLVVATPLWNAPVFIASAVLLCCLLIAYGCWRLLRLKTPAMLGPIIGGSLTACILAAGAMDLCAVYSSSRMEVKHEDEPLVKGLVFRRSPLYKIPGSFPATLGSADSPAVAREDSSRLPVKAFEGGRGSGRGQFDNPHGLAVDSAGNIFVADSGNDRIEKFSPKGTFVMSIAAKDPNGIAIDSAGNIYVAEIGSKHRVQKFGPNGTFITKWAPGFYGPRKIAIGHDDSV